MDVFVVIHVASYQPKPILLTGYVGVYASESEAEEAARELNKQLYDDRNYGPGEYGVAKVRIGESLRSPIFAQRS